MIEQGLVLMGAGIGVVFVFLLALVASVHGAAAIIRRVEARRAAGESAGGAK